MDNASLVNWFLEKWYGKPQTATVLDVEDGVLFDGGSPTQSDKPSPHSSYGVDELWSLARKGFRDTNGIKCYRVANTNSMEPLFDDNSLVIMEVLTPKIVDRQPLAKGDIVIYESNGIFIIHRLVDVQLFNGVRGWLIRGDNNKLPDGWVLETKIRERLVGILYGKEVRSND